MQFLMDEPQPRGARRSGLAKRHRHAIKQDGPRVRALQSREDADEGLLARPIFAHECVHFTRVQLDVDPIQRAQGTEMARDPVKP